MIDWLLFNIHTINFWYSAAGLATLGVTFGLVYDYIFNEQRLYLKFINPYIWMIIIAATMGGVATTLLYSEVFGFIPCSLCWLQRVALYPQVILVLVAFKLKDTKQFPLYGLALAIFGLLVAVYHFIYQSLPSEILDSGLLPCLADGSADCSKKVMEVFGFVTFPFLSAVLFAFLIVLYLHLFRANRIK
jgi:disulfide bond formation protein DsbB